MASEKVCIVGSGNWGSAIARIVGANAARHDLFETKVNMWVYQEQIDGKNLTDIINETHVNVKYLPDAKLPENVYAEADLSKAAEGATILIFVLPHQFLGRLAPQILGKCAPGCRAISLIKGLEFENGSPKLISSLITEALDKMACSVLMGANVSARRLLIPYPPRATQTAFALPLLLAAVDSPGGAADPPTDAPSSSCAYHGSPADAAAR